MPIIIQEENKLYFDIEHFPMRKNKVFNRIFKSLFTAGVMQERSGIVIFRY